VTVISVPEEARRSKLLSTVRVMVLSADTSGVDWTIKT